MEKELQDLLANAALTPVQRWAAFVDLIRPENRFRAFQNEATAARLNRLVMTLESSPELCAQWAAQLETALLNCEHAPLYTEAGIQKQTAFFPEFFRRISYQILPPVLPEETLPHFLNTIFNHYWDWMWTQNLSNEKLCRLFELIAVHFSARLQQKFYQGILNAVVILSHRVTGIGLEEDVTSKMPQVDDLDSPFIVQSKEITLYFEKYHPQPGALNGVDNLDYRQIVLMLKQCDAILVRMREDRHLYGASLHLTYLMQKLHQSIERIQKLLYFLHADDKQMQYQTAVTFFKAILSHEKKRNDVSELFAANTDVIFYQVVEHTSVTGEHYITSTLKEWLQMGKKAGIGGCVVGALCLIKLWIHNLHLSPFGTALGYSLNYGLGFVGIHLMGGTIATKQPAMIASKMASVLDQPEHKADPKAGLAELVDMITRIVRSQAIALFGNVALAFPVAFLLSMIYYWTTGEPPANADKAHHIIHDVDPFHSPALPHAAIAGFWLFLSGLLSGFYDNSVIYNKLPERLQAHPLLRRLVGPRYAGRFAAYIKHNLGALVGNFSLGVMLGCTPIIGQFFGLPLDIRHITFSSGNFALALASLGGNIELSTFFVSLLGILGIGLVNLSVSFSLSLFMAARSRQITFRQWRQLWALLLFSFFTRPLPFFVPVGAPKTSSH